MTQSDWPPKITLIPYRDLVRPVWEHGLLRTMRMRVPAISLTEFSIRTGLDIVRIGEIERRRSEPTDEEFEAIGKALFRRKT